MEFSRPFNPGAAEYVPPGVGSTPNQIQQQNYPLIEVPIGTGTSVSTQDEILHPDQHLVVVPIGTRNVTGEWCGKRISLNKVLDVDPNNETVSYTHLTLPTKRIV